MYLFVYGTLQRHSSAHEMIEEAEFKGEGCVYGTLYDLGVGFPAIVEEGTRQQVYGEVYKVDPNLLEELDEYEGYKPDEPEDSLFVRKEVSVFMKDKTRITAEAYIMPAEKLSQFFAIELKKDRWRE